MKSHCGLQAKMQSKIQSVPDKALAHKGKGFIMARPMAVWRHIAWPELRGGYGEAVRLGIFELALGYIHAARSAVRRPRKKGEISSSVVEEGINFEEGVKFLTSIVRSPEDKTNETIQLCNQARLVLIKYFLQHRALRFRCDWGRRTEALKFIVSYFSRPESVAGLEESELGKIRVFLGDRWSSLSSFIGAGLVDATINVGAFDLLIKYKEFRAMSTLYDDILAVYEPSHFNELLAGSEIKLRQAEDQFMNRVPLNSSDSRKITAVCADVISLPDCWGGSNEKNALVRRKAQVLLALHAMYPKSSDAF